YGLGKTFYWPTLLGVISERFPKGGALALGLSGGVGMIGAGILGGPGIGYKQDYFAVEFLHKTPEGEATYQRYVARVAKFKLTNQVFDALKKENLPESVLTKLGTLKDKEFSRDDFVGEINKILNTSESKEYQSIILNYAGELDEKGFPIVTGILPTQVPKIAGIDNSKLKVFEDYNAGLDADDKLKPETQVKLTDETTVALKSDSVPDAVIAKLIPLKNKVLKKKDLEVELDKLLSKEEKEQFQNVILKQVIIETTLESDLDTLKREEAEGKQIEPKLKTNLTDLHDWWKKEGKPNYDKDKKPLLDAKLSGAKTALLYTAVVPAVLAVGFLLLILYFALSGGYKQVHLEDTHPPMEEY
ncbi:MAG TPA: hypothetical protein VG097_15920, partial [Gemmata sp.]|nr:hypothetical protein [Gemmata sp.]